MFAPGSYGPSRVSDDIRPRDDSLVRFGIHCNRPDFGGATLPWILPDPGAGPNPHALCVAGSKDDRSCGLRLANAPRPLIAWASAVFPVRVSRSRRPAITSSRPVKDGFLGWETFQNAWPAVVLPSGGDGPIKGFGVP